MGPDHVQQFVRREGGWLSTEELLDKEKETDETVYSDGYYPPPPPGKSQETLKNISK
jgi:hypothetical protein